MNIQSFDFNAQPIYAIRKSVSQFESFIIIILPPILHPAFYPYHLHNLNNLLPFLVFYLSEIFITQVI